MNKVPICICVAVIIIKYVEAGVITSATQIGNTNKIDEGVQYQSDNDIREEFGLRKKPTFPTISSAYENALRKITLLLGNIRDAGDTYRFEKRIDKYSSVIPRVENMLKRNVMLRYQNYEKLPKLTDLHIYDSVQNQNEIANQIGDVVEISLSDNYSTTEENSSPNEELVAENDNNKLVTEFIRSRTVIPTKSDCHSDVLEEKKDLDKFIFMPGSKDLEKDVINDGDIETTTAYNLVEERRLKRGVNMIEEENMGTTISGFKLTGHDARLSNDLYYKNINS